MTGIEFGDPPPVTRGGPSTLTAWSRIAQQLRERPGEWAKVNTYANPRSAHSMVTQIRAGYRSGMPKGEFDATARGAEVWARYVGGES